MISKSNRLVGAILLVSGTTVGAGMLALPITTGLAGFIPSLLVMSGMWLFMMLTAFYFLEVNLRMPGESNMISMAHKTLGPLGEGVAWIVYLLLFYSLLSAYFVGCSELLAEAFAFWSAPKWVWALFVFLFFASFIYFGTLLADFLNRVMMFGLGAVFVALLAYGLTHIEGSYLLHFEWGYLLPSISVVSTTFGYHIIIPTLTTYLEHDPKLLKKAIFIGSAIPFVIYVLWQLVVMGAIPAEQLLATKKIAFPSVWVSWVKGLFSFFAIVTSLVGVSLSLNDFLFDGLKIKKAPLSRVGITLLTFVPPLIFALFFPGGFVQALSYAGIFVVILLALLPALMAWFERYSPKGKLSKPTFAVPFGKVGIIVTVIISVLLLGVEIIL